VQRDKSKANLDFWKEVKLTRFLSVSGYFETMDPTQIEGLQTFLPFSTAELIQFHPTQTSYSVCIGHGTANKNVVASTPSTVYIALVLKFTEVTCLLD